ncbi:mechanosensitive ion channel family protein [Nannocystis radixulma]|uniref:Mechanosensitive ion channel family protein n=1 Tax=Nannocystis radixulma TaxID=2995305 RepID=A0ABT5BRD2_9BACT|nr:mechanosensitive ion channel family protein [Nannocystis radixulma]MDC0675547.1 mechanosensitive ion channel family protein [Nannocystis radixulma]
MGELDLEKLLLSPELQAAGGLILALVVGYAISTAVAGALARAAAQTHRDLDQQLLALMRRPVWVTAVIVALEWAGDRLQLAAAEQATFDATLGTIVVVVWATALVRAVDEVLVALLRRASSGQQGLAFVRGRAAGLIHFLVRIVLLLAGLYLVMVLWGLDVRAWQVSAGVAGAVLGFAAQDSLGNLISAVFLVGDAPLRIGDYIRVDKQMRGRVTDIGWRSTRILTNDGVEVNLPNARLGAQRIVNESAGPHQAIRLACEFAVEYGRTPEEVRAAVLPGVAELPELRGDLPAELQFRGPTEAGLRFALVVYLANPSRRSQGTDVTNSHILRALRAAGIGLAYSSHEVHAGGPLATALQAALVPGPSHVH